MNEWFVTPDQAARFWLFIFGLWAVCAVVNVGIADWKGKNRVLWGLVGLGLGPFGLGLLLWRLRRRSEEPSSLAGGPADRRVQCQEESIKPDVHARDRRADPKSVPKEPAS